MVKREKSPLRKLIDERGVRGLEGVHALVKELTGSLIQEIMDAELEDELGYSKYDYRNKQTDKSRNGHFNKTVSSSQGEIELKVPRDRKGEYEPQIVPKHPYLVLPLWFERRSLAHLSPPCYPPFLASILPHFL